MKTSTFGRKKRQDAINYQALSLVDLITLVADEGDANALEEFHERRPVFNTLAEVKLRFGEYLNDLKNRVLERNKSDLPTWESANRAFDQTLDKFFNLPSGMHAADDKISPRPPNVKHRGIDCRLYYRAYLNHIRKNHEKRPPKGPVDEERRAAYALQIFVHHHFQLSMRDAKRKANPFWSRYNWLIDGESICVRLPISLKGRERCRWLEKNIGKPDLSRPGERLRIQAAINARLASMSLVPFDDSSGQITKGYHLGSEPFIYTEDFRVNLAAVIAEEKSAGILRQRRSIQKLGGKKLKKMILQIFEDLGADDLQDHQIAKKFNLSKATYSRFAGSRWSESGSQVPDLWRNTAGVLASNPSFREAAKNSGVWDRIVTTVGDKIES